MRIVLEHPPRQVSGDRFDHVIRLAGLEQPGDDLWDVRVVEGARLEIDSARAC